ncbi:hypothetical protein [Streptacidiphilus cavernicola]|uniref:Uncharacterized protein n=1 Tax=Streptacidiphilus cavernicola TaxID=3342716 RepID=A0ABV6VSM4_9ACTN
MMPRSNPIQIPSHLRGDADQDTLDGLVRTSRRLGLFWPLLASSEPAPTPDHLGFPVSAHTASLVRDLSEYGS